MGMWTAVRGWLELDGEQRAEVEQVIAGSRFAGGWAFAPMDSWSTYLMYGKDVKDLDVPDLLDLVTALARVTPTDVDGDTTLGFFVLTDEYARVAGPSHFRPF